MFRTVCAAGALLIYCGTSLAQEARVYTPADFEQYAPRTALDMVSQIPGFSVERDDDGSRGFGQASGNVIINGQRISGKSNDARSALGRIPAGNVERIEIVDGTTLDIPGLTGQVANVIAKGSEGISGTWEWESRIRENIRPALDQVNASVTGTNGALTWALEGEIHSPRGAGRGVENAFDNRGTLTERRQEDFNFVSQRPSVSGSLAWTPENGHIANLNANYAVWTPEVKEESIRFPVGGVETRRIFRRSEDEWNGEIGGDYELGVGPGRLKGIGLVRRENSPFLNRLLIASIDGATREQTLFEQTIDEGEYILRGEYSWQPAEGRDWQIALEGAFNYLESEAAFFESFDGGPLVEVDLDNSNSRVEETRTEVAVTHSRTLTPKLSMQASLAVEQSEIVQDGAGGLARTFTRPKGFLSGTYAFSDDYKLTARLERQVGQLNFFDFISSTNINEGNDRDGNPELVPQQSWLGELEIERGFGAWGAGTVKVFGEDIEDLVDRIPLPGGGDGVGNIDTANLYGIEFDTTLKFDPIGFKGGQVELSGTWGESSVTDPVTGQDRRINRGRIREFEIDFRHDIPNTDWAYGIGAEQFVQGRRFLLDQEVVNRDQGAFAYAYLEHKDIFGLTGSVFLGNLTDTGDFERRFTYTPDRTGDLLSYEVRNRKFGPILEFGLSGSF